MNKSLSLIALYLYICEVYDTELKFHCQRFSNHHSGFSFSDEELLTTYLFSIMAEKKTETKAIWQFIRDYWHDWFPQLPSYQSYNRRINRMASLFPALLSHILSRGSSILKCQRQISVIDSFPIMMCSDRRNAKVAIELADSGYCAVKRMHYHGVKLHFVGFHQPGTIPFPEILKISSASEHDLSSIKPELLQLSNRTFYADKIYSHKAFNEELRAKRQAQIITPIKKHGRESVWERQWEEAYRRLYSEAVSKIRQPVESFFNWLIQKTDIQNASKVRSLKGLIVHVFGKLAAAFLPILIKP